MYEGEYFILKIDADRTSFDKLEVIGVKKYNLPISESDLTFPHSQIVYKFTENSSNIV